MSSEQSGHSFQTGDIVVHKKFGEGVVTDASAADLTSPTGEKNQQVTVNFTEVGEKRVAGSFLKLEREVHRIDQLRETVKIYGQRSLATHDLLKRFGQRLLRDLGPYLHRERRLVHGVPPRGPWTTDEDYHDAAFSSYAHGLIRLEPLEIGIAIRVDNLEDSGAVWIRLVLTLRKSGDKILLAIGDLSELTLPINYDVNAVRAACDLVFETAIKLFAEDVEYDLSGCYGTDGPIGFIRIET